MKKLTSELKLAYKKIKQYETVLARTNATHAHFGGSLQGEWGAYADCYRYDYTISIFTPDRIKYELIKAKDFFDAYQIFDKAQSGKLSSKELMKLAYNTVDLKNVKTIDKKDVGIEEWLRAK